MSKAARHLLAPFLAGAVLAAHASAEAWGQEKSVPRLKPISMSGNPAAGERAYLASCWACHGLAGDGKGPAAAGMTPPPTDFTPPGALDKRTTANLLDIILKGKPGTAMYPTGVDPQAAVDLVAFLRTLSRNPGQEKSFLESLARADREAGRILYERRCWPCHGATGAGDGPAAPALRPPPADFTDPDKVTDRSAARLYSVLSRGIPGTAMAAQPLEEKEKIDVIAYLRSLVRFPEESKAPGEALPSGDPRKGKETYDRRCWACHGASGDGNGPAAADMAPPPTSFFDYDAMKSRTDQDWFNAIRSGVPGTAMYPQRLSVAEITDLVAYLRGLGRRKPAVASPDDPQKRKR